MNKKALLQKIEGAKKIHNDFYDYSLIIENPPKTIYYNTKIICPIHGVFEMSLNKHVGGGCGCPKCSGVAKVKQDEFIELCKKAHGDDLDFSLVDYKNCKTNVNVICHKKDIFGKEHGIFSIRPDHLRNGHGCPKCAHRNLTNEEWIAMAKAVHGKGIYDYSLINYPNKQKEKGKFICHKVDENGIEHGIFEQSYGSHLRGCGCPKCKGGVRHDKDLFTKNARKVHGNKFIYDSFVYVNAHTKGIITCPIHGDFLQEPSAHLSGEGCPFCKNSILEAKVARLLESLGLYYESNVKFEGLGKQTIDFYIPQKKLYIECQGEQHYIPTKFDISITDEEAAEMLNSRINLDKQKYESIIGNGFNIVYYSDAHTFHCKNVDVFGGWYSNKHVFNKIINLSNYISKLESFDDFEVKEPKKIVSKNSNKPKRTRWTYEKCLEEAKKYSSKSEMKTKNQSAYNVSVRYGWINEFYVDKKRDDRYWGILDNVLTAAKKSKNARDMIRKFGGAYNSAIKHGWLDKLVYNVDDESELELLLQQ